MSDYLLPCHPYGENHPKKRDFEGNVVALMEHAFTLLSLVEHDCFRNLTQDLNPRLRPVGRSKLSWSLIPTENQLLERSVIERLVKVKAVVIRYNLCISGKTEEIFLLESHYCTCPERNNTNIGMSAANVTDGVSLSSYIMEVVDNFGLEANIVGITSDGGGNIWICREALESKYTNDSDFHHPIPYLRWSDLHIYWQGLARQE